MWTFVGILFLMVSMFLSVASIVGLIKPSFLNNKFQSLLKGKIYSRLKWFGVLTLLSFFSFVISAVGIINSPNSGDVKQNDKQPEQQVVDNDKAVDNSKQQIEQQQEADKAKSRLDEDVQKLSDFHRKLIEAEEMCASANSMWKKVKNPNVYDMYDVAKNAKLACGSASQKIPKTPEFNNQEVTDKIKKAEEASKNTLFAYLSANSDFMEAADSGVLSPSKMSDIKDGIAYGNASAVQEAAAIISAYSMLNVPIDKIDTEKGGIKP